MNTRFLHQYGPWAVVTGASDGIGRAFATELASRGFNLVLSARRHSELDHLAESLRSRFGGRYLVVAGDLTERVVVEALLERTRDLDVGLCIPAAGFGTSGELRDANLKTEHNMLHLNCGVVLTLAHAFSRRLAARGRGGLILMSSLLAFQGVPRAAHYAATKAYVQTLGEGLRLELRAHGVNVLLSAPGPIQTGFAARANMQMGFAQPPELVARQSLAALGRTTVRPGWLSKLLEYSMTGLPRWLRSKILAIVMRGMTRHQAVAAMGSQP